MKRFWTHLLLSLLCLLFLQASMGTSHCFELNPSFDAPPGFNRLLGSLPILWADLKISTSPSYPNQPVNILDYRIVWVLAGTILVLLILGLFLAFLMRKSKKNLEKKEKKFRDLFELSQDGVLLRRLGDNVFYDCNKAMLEMLGYEDKDEFLKLGPKGIVFTNQPDGNPIEHLLERAKKVLLEQGKDRFEGLFKRKDGTPMYAEVVACLVDIDGTPTIQSVVRDMSHRKMMEDNLRKLSSAVEASSAAILITDSDGSVEYVNPKFTELTGYELHEIEGLNPRFLKSGKQDKEYYKRLWECILSGKEWHGTILNKKKNGDEYWARASISSVLDESGTISNFVHIQDDITDSKRLEAELLQAKKEADNANKAKGDFLARMSHEIRTPMNAVIGMSHLALLTGLNPKQKDYVSKAHGAAKSLLGIINDILDFSKIEAGKLEFETVEFNLDEIFEKLSAIVSLKASEKKLEVLFDISKETPRYLKGDPLRLQQVLTNLVNNALKFTEHGEIIVSVKPGATKNNTVELLFHVVDSGIGLSQEQQSRLFQAFTQADGSTTRKYGGTGLGLTICKKLVELMEGEIGVKSSPGQGSDFFFSGWFGMSVKKSDQPHLFPPELAGKQVLVVDDNPVARRVLTAGIEGFKFNITTTDSGEKALEEIDRNGMYDLILMDWELGGINGIETSKKILEHDGAEHTSIIMITAYGKEEIAAKAQVAGIKQYLVKPVARNILIQAVLKAFGCIEEEKSGDGSKKYFSKLGIVRGRSVLLVEDNELNQQVATELLEKVDLHVTIAGNGVEAVELVEKKTFDLILMDIQMPVMDGLEATKRIRKHHPDLPIIAMTASAMADDREKCEKAGMNDYVTKPIEPEDLYEAIIRRLPGLTSLQSVSQPGEKTGNDELPAIQDVDTAAGLKRVGGNRTLYRKFLLQFCEEHSTIVTELDRLLSNNDFSEAERIIHTFKGLCGSIGANSLQEFAKSIEHSIKNNELEKYNEEKGDFAQEVTVLVERITSSLKDSIPEKTPNVDAGYTLLAEQIEKLLPFIESMKPKQAGACIEQISSYSWPEEVNNTVENLITLVRKYRYKQALPVAREILEKCQNGQGENNGTPVEKMPGIDS